MTAGCPECTGTVEHCHGTLIRHDAGSECTDPDCRAPEPDRHALLVTCGALDGECAVEVVGARPGPAR